ncbi:MAG: hypothetical protein IFK92_04795, partial [Acidobacteria bacterium]|nr:hypothetical protein [Candidatus Sulfomarinibacter kjeldsenii]
MPTRCVPLEAEIDSGQHSCPRQGLGHEDAAHQTRRDVLVGMAGEEDVDAGHRSQPPDEILVGGAIRFAAVGVLLEAGVGKHHDNVAVFFCAQDRDPASRGIVHRFKNEPTVILGFLPAGHVWGDETEDADPDRPLFEDRIGLVRWLPGFLVQDIGRQEWEIGLFPGPFEYLATEVEFVVADCHRLVADAVHRVDGRARLTPPNVGELLERCPLKGVARIEHHDRVVGGGSDLPHESRNLGQRTAVGWPIRIVVERHHRPV